jgi:pantetheine-phosphate adenylyltransferase
MGRTMTKSKPKIAVFPGSFDPVSLGHVDVIRRGARLFDELVVAVGTNPDKSPWLTVDERTVVITKVVRDMPNVRVETYDGLTVDLATRLGASAILRGLRGGADLHYELQVAMTNRQVAGIETLFVVTSPEHAFLSSSLIRQIARGGGDISSFVPSEALAAIQRKLA